MPNFEYQNTQKCLAFVCLHIFFVLLIVLILYEDSTRYLMTLGEHEQAFTILEKIIKRSLNSEEKQLIKNNYYNDSSKIIIKENKSDKKREETKSSKSILSVCTNEINIISIFWSKYSNLIILVMIVAIINSMTLYGMLIVENLEITVMEGNQYHRLSTSIDENKNAPNYIQTSKDKNTSAQSINGTQLTELLLIALSGNINILIGFMMDIPLIGRKGYLYFLNFLGIVNMISLFKNPSNIVFVYSLIINCNLGFNNGYTVFVAELANTNVRPLMLGIYYGSLSLGGFFSQIGFIYLFTIDPFIPFYICTGSYVVFSILLYFHPPDTCGKDLDC